MSTNPTTGQNETSEWKKALWHDISLAAQDKGTFEEDDYDKNGDLNPRSAKFEELCTWLVCLFHFHLQDLTSRRTTCYVLTNMSTECASSQGSI
jgi:Fe-S-cluster formation regulator IscX/YfhJ